MSGAETVVLALDSRALTEITAEGWRQIDSGPTGEWIWLHPPTSRVVTLHRRKDGAWWVKTVLYDEEGNPKRQLHAFLVCGGTCPECRACFAELGPFEDFAEAVRHAHAVRRSIEAEVLVEPFPTQIDVFGAKAEGER